MAHEPVYYDSGRKHPYHLVKPSAWPLLASLAAGLLTGGGVFFMHRDKTVPAFHQFPGAWMACAGFIAVLLVMYVWWRDIVKEAVVEKAHSPIAKLGLRYGMALFIASEVMFFVAFFWAYFAAALYPPEAIGGIWPPRSITPVDPWHFPLLMTLILLLSGCTVTWAHHEIVEGNRKAATQGLIVTVLLGVAFTGVQVYEYMHTEFGFTDTIFASTFYMATGFHGFHVLVGTIFLFVCLIRNAKGHFEPKSHFGFEAAAWYWHFVDVVWLFLFAAIYWWGSLGAVAAPHH